jgi:succinate--hydroxymethylglutarate CoA-transferase
VQFKRFSAAIGHPELATDPNFSTNAQRIINRATLIPVITKIFKEKTMEEWNEIFEGKGCASCAIFGR